MLEYEQVFIGNVECPICSSVIEKGYFHSMKRIELRKFVTLAGNPERVCCTNCSYSTTLHAIKKQQEVKNNAEY